MFWPFLTAFAPTAMNEFFSSMLEMKDCHVFCFSSLKKWQNPRKELSSWGQRSGPSTAMNGAGRATADTM